MVKSSGNLDRIGTASVGLAVLLGLLLYLACSWAGGHVGFPLDDAWIHQTYARNLVERGQWAFVPGQPSAGSTSPLWTLLLAAGYALGLPFRLWAYGLGGLCLFGTALLARRLATHLWEGSQDQIQNSKPRSRPGRFSSICRWDSGFWVLSFLIALEWHLVWAAVSGMETLFFTLLALALWNRVAAGPARRSFLTGLLGGALVLTRPEGVLAVGLAAVGVMLAEGFEGRWLKGAAAASSLAAGAVLLVVPYLALNLYLSGTLWPNTFYAKQAEYAFYLAQPLPVRLWRMAALPLIGGQVLLLPGLFWSVWQEARRWWRGLSRSGLAGGGSERRRAGSRGRGRGEGGRGRGRVGWWLPLAWALTTIVTYALRLPVAYQHGRYLIPVVPILVVYGAVGLLDYKVRIPTPKTRRTPRPRGLLWNLGFKVWALATLLLFAAFWFLGGRAYGTDVAIIEEEMVAVARWLDVHTAPDSLIAVHDIGAVGYFAHRPLLDLAGLVNPEVVPFIRDEGRLLSWLEGRGADYLVAFPSWYPALTADPRLEEVHRTNAQVTVAQGGENMAVYALR